MDYEGVSTYRKADREDFHLTDQNNKKRLLQAGWYRFATIFFCAEMYMDKSGLLFYTEW
ncbi:MAG: hypothetical protein ACLVJ7_15840 [Acutalibacteraceae bacterium]